MDRNLHSIVGQVWLVFGLLCLLTGTAFAASPQLPSFKQAMQRELQELQQTRLSLQQTLKRLRDKNRARNRALQGKVRGLIVNLERLRKQSTSTENQISGLKRRWTTIREYKDLLKGTLSLGTRTLQKELPKLRLKGSTPTQIKQLFAKGSTFLRRSSSVHQARETFFGLDGKMLRGKVVHVGEVAALGVAGTQGGVLMRLPDGALRLLPMRKGDFQAAQNLLSDKWLETIPVYLFDPLSKSRKAPKKTGALSKVEAGGPIALIILSLAALGVLLLLERLWTLNRLSLGSERRWKQSLELLQGEKWELAYEKLRKMGLAAEALATMVRHKGETREALEQRASEALLQSMPSLERSNAILNVLVTVAPLLGLLGTVTGMISTFDVITVHGTGNPRLLSQGISEALITTELGLAVAIPLLLAKSFFARWAARLLEQSQLRALRLLDFVSVRKESIDEKDAA